MKNKKIADAKKKKNRRGNSIFKKYFIHTASIVILALIFIGITTIVFVASEWWNEKIDSLTKNAQTISYTIDSFEFDKPKQNFEQKTPMRLTSLLSIMSNATASDYFITDKDGNIVACKDETKNTSVNNCENHSKMKITKHYMQRALEKGFSDYTSDDVFGFGKFVVAVPLTAPQSDYAAVFAVEDAITGLFPYVLKILKTTALTAFIGLIVCFIYIFFTCRSITRPLSEMQEVTKHFAKGEFKHRANENYEDKYLVDFARSLNKMADELSIEEEAKRSFVANVSHELKTPMTTIGGFIDGILDGTIPKENERDYLKTVSNEVKRLSRMVVAMLNLSKIEAGEVSIAPVKYDISLQIFETLLLFEERINEKKISVEGFESMDHVLISADKDLLQQVIYNLIDNAVKFTPENGKISVYAENTEEKTVVKIRNTGKGVSNDEISRIFERFYKVDKSRSYDVKGVGLGLYIVKTIVNMHDGEITASSVEDKYIEFSFEIPN